MYFISVPLYVAIYYLDSYKYNMSYKPFHVGSDCKMSNVETVTAFFGSTRAANLYMRQFFVDKVDQ